MSNLQSYYLLYHQQRSTVKSNIFVDHDPLISVNDPVFYPRVTIDYRGLKILNYHHHKIISIRLEKLNQDCNKYQIIINTKNIHL